MELTCATWTVVILSCIEVLSDPASLYFKISKGLLGICDIDHSKSIHFYSGCSVQLDAPPLSPLPVTRKQIHSPKKISKQHQIYISPIKRSELYLLALFILFCFYSWHNQSLEIIRRIRLLQEGKLIYFKLFYFVKLINSPIECPSRSFILKIQKSNIQENCPWLLSCLLVSTLSTYLPSYFRLTSKYSPDDSKE